MAIYDDSDLALEGLNDSELEGYEGLGAGYDVREDLGIAYRTTFGVERGRRVRPDKGAAEKHLADTLRAVGHKDADADAEAVSKAVGGDPRHLRAIEGAVRVTHKKRGKKKGNLDLAGLVHKRLRRHNPNAAARFKGVHAKHRHDRESKKQRLIHALEKKGHKHKDAVKLATVAGAVTGSDLGATDALTNAVLAAPSGTAFSMAQTMGTLSPAFALLFAQYAAQAGVNIGPPSAGFLGGLFRRRRGPTGDKLYPGAALMPGNSMMSAGSSTKVIMGPASNSWNGEVDLKDPTQGDKQMWHISEAHDGGAQGAYLLMRRDGQLVVTDPNGKIWWSSASSTDTKSAPVAGAYFMVQDDGNLVVYDQQGNALWSPNTYKNFGRNPQPAQGPTAQAANAAAAQAAAQADASAGVGVPTTPTGPLESLPDQYASSQRPDVSTDPQPGDTDTDDGGGASASAGFSASASAGGGGNGGASADGGGGGDGGGDGGAPTYNAPTADASGGATAQLNINVSADGGASVSTDGGDAAAGGTDTGDGSSPASGDTMGYDLDTAFSDEVSFGYQTPFSLKG